MTRTTPAFVKPEPSRFIYLGIQATRPQRAPLYRRSRTRDARVAAASEAAAEIAGRPGVVRVQLFVADLIPPLHDAPRYDIAVLVRAVPTAPADLAAGLAEALGGTVILDGRNAARIGVTRYGRDKHFLFNHFESTAADTVEVWRGLTGWYLEKTGIDNSIAIVADRASLFPFVNHAQLPGSPVAFLLRQLARPSFHSFVRRTLRRHGMRALPAIHRLAWDSQQ